MDMKQKLLNYLKAGYPGIAIQTTEEARAMTDVIAAAKKADKKVITWSATEGLMEITDSVKAIEETTFLADAAKHRSENTVYIFRDPHTWPFDRDPVLARSFRDMFVWAPQKGSCAILIAPVFKPHGTFENLVTVLDYTLPSREDLTMIARNISESAERLIDPSNEVLRALGGLSTTEAENALALSLVETGGFDAQVIYREKVQAVKRSGLLDIVDPDPKGLDAIGGLENLKVWIMKRKKAYTPEAERFGLSAPKGILLCGVPGTGKSLAAKAIGTALSVPTIKLDLGGLFNSLVGESEARTRDALKLAEAMSPCVLWIDEIDKGLAGSSGSGSGDSGVTRRVFGTIISWMQERRRPVFLVATANQVEGLPPELLRKGRFDELFAIDLPHDAERAAIFGIHIVKRKRDLKNFDASAMAKATEGFTGSEIENVIEEAMFGAFDSGGDISTALIIECAKNTVPLSKTAKEQIDRIRSWAQNRARFASIPAEAEILTATVGKRRL